MSTPKASRARKLSRQAEHGTGEILGTGLREKCKAKAGSDGSKSEPNGFPTRGTRRRGASSGVNGTQRTSGLSLLDKIRDRVDEQRNRYGARWNQILRDRANLLTMVNNREYIIERLLRCSKNKLCKDCRTMAIQLLNGTSPL